MKNFKGKIWKFNLANLSYFWVMGMPYIMMLILMPDILSKINNSLPSATAPTPLLKITAIIWIIGCAIIFLLHKTKKNNLSCKRKKIKANKI